jgi:hypothetical protein
VLYFPCFHGSSQVSLNINVEQKLIKNIKEYKY